MTDWTSDELQRVGRAEELEITTARPDGSLRPWVPIWVVRVGDELLVRSFRGPDGAWYRHATRRPEGRIHADGAGARRHLHPVSVETRTGSTTQKERTGQVGRKAPRRSGPRCRGVDVLTDRPSSLRAHPIASRTDADPRERGDLAAA